MLQWRNANDPQNSILVWHSTLNHGAYFDLGNPLLRTTPGVNITNYDNITFFSFLMIEITKNVG